MALLGRRVAARLIDCSLLGFTLAVLWASGFRLTTTDCNGVSRCYGLAGVLIGALIVIFGMVITILYDSVAVFNWGTTIGKSALGLRVTRLDGSRPVWSQCQARAITFWLSMPVSGILAYVLYLMFGEFVPALWRSSLGWYSWQFQALVVLSPLCLTAATFLLTLFRGTPIHDWVAGTRVTNEVQQGVPSISAKTGWSRAAKIAGGITLATATMGVLVWALIGGRPHELSASERQSYVQDNQHLLDSLPQIPGSRRLDLQSLPYCTNGSIIGYSTWVTYQTAAQMSHQDIVDFYVRNLGDAWPYTVTNEPIGLPPSGEHPYGAVDTVTSAQFKQGSAIVSVSIMPPPPEPQAGSYPNSYQVMVDSHRPGGANCHLD